MGGDGIERFIKAFVIGNAGPFAAEAGEKGPSLRGFREKPMHIAATRKAIGRRRAISASIVETQHGPRAIRPKTAANMHFIAGEGNAVLGPCALHAREQFFVFKYRFNIEQA